MPNTSSDSHSVQTRNRIDVVGNQEERLICCFRENYMPRLNSFNPGKQERFDRSFRTQDIPILENKVIVANRDSDHASYFGDRTLPLVARFPQWDQYAQSNYSAKSYKRFGLRDFRASQ